MKQEIYMNKISGELSLIIPWFMTIEEDIDFKYEPDGILIAYGMFQQVGWMLENGHGVYFGLGITAIDQFEYIGEL